MKIFLDSASYDSIKEWNETGILDGVTTNPSHLSKEKGDPMQEVKKICKLMHDKDVSIEVTETEPKKVYAQAKKLAELAENVTVKIPCHQDYYALISKLVQEGIRINVTLVFTLIQALCMCKLGVRYISPFVGRWDDIDVSGIQQIYETRSMMDTYGYLETELLAASIRTVRVLHEVIQAGADVATVPADVLAKAVTHPLTDQGIEKFNADWKKLGIKQFP